MKKKIIAIILSVLMLLSVLPVASFAGTLGDVNSSGKIDATDARITLRAAVGLEKLTDAQMELADVDFNGTVNATDARLILRAAVGLEKLPEAPQNEAPASPEYDILKSGSFRIKGTMVDNTGVDTPMEIAVTPESIYMLSDFGGIDMGMLIKGKKVYMICPDKKAYLEMSEAIMNMAGLDISELTASDAIDFSIYGDLSEADSIKEVTHNGRVCQVYCFKLASEESRVYLDGTKIVRLASYDNNGKFLAAIDITEISGNIPAGMISPPSGYKAYKGVTGMFSFMSLLEG
jgi:hypothetical protein